MSPQYQMPEQTPSHPVEDRLETLSKSDYAQLEKKIAFMEKLPKMIWIGGFGMLAIMVIMFAAIGGLSWMFGLFVASCIVMLVAVQVFVRNYFGKLYKDISANKKRVVIGVLELARKRDKDKKYEKGPTVPSFGYEWGVGGKIFSIDEDMFGQAKVGDKVELLMLPESELVFAVGRVVPAYDPWTGQ